MICAVAALRPCGVVFPYCGDNEGCCGTSVTIRWLQPSAFDRDRYVQRRKQLPEPCEETCCADTCGAALYMCDRGHREGIPSDCRDIESYADMLPGDIHNPRVCTKRRRCIFVRNLAVKSLDASISKPYRYFGARNSVIRKEFARA